MPTLIQDLLHAFDGHCVDDVRAALQRGANPCEPVDGKLPIYWLLEEYTRSDRLPECLRLLIERGAKLDETDSAHGTAVLLSVLLNDRNSIEAALEADRALVKHRTTLKSAFTSLEDVTLLHVAAEYGNLDAAEVLIEYGADVNATAGSDRYGLNGHTPLFHTVNSNGNRSVPIMRTLLAAGTDAQMKLRGLRWGAGYPWETVFFDVTPVSFAQMGLLPQVHRKESDIYANIAELIRAAGQQFPPLANVPNKYLNN